MEVLQSIARITLGFLPMLGSMELAWRLYEKRRSKKNNGKKGGWPCHVTKEVLKHCSNYFI
jgi:hypothetical protein